MDTENFKRAFSRVTQELEWGQEYILEALHF